MKQHHPRPDDHGRPVVIDEPSTSSPLGHWQDPLAIAGAVPDQPMPAHIGSVAACTTVDAPTSDSEWEALARTMHVSEPPWPDAGSLDRAAGAVVCEPDGRIWVVCPTNGFGGYRATFPKGRLEGRSAAATALVETLEEAGLTIRLLDHLIDVRRTETLTRYFVAERLGGNPAAMGWESQAVILVPPQALPAVVSHPNDAAVVKAIVARLKTTRRADLPPVRNHPCFASRKAG